MVHIDEVIRAFEEFNAAALEARHHFRNPSKWNSIMDAARAKLKRFCDDHKLPIDFTRKDWS